MPRLSHGTPVEHPSPRSLLMNSLTFYVVYVNGTDGLLMERVFGRSQMWQLVVLKRRENLHFSGWKMTAGTAVTEAALSALKATPAGQ
jgi:hypothetical protein